METFKYRGKVVTQSEVIFINQLIKEHPECSRWALSKKLCAAWGWVQLNGELRDMVCRSLMLKLDRAGLIELPPVRRRPPNNAIMRQKPKQHFLVDTSELCCKLSRLGALEFEQIRRKPAEKLFDFLIEEYHYLGFSRPVGEHLKYLVYADKRPIACFVWSSATRHLGIRDEYIGWNLEARRKNIKYLAYNSRFLILPWVRVPHLASHLLGRMAKLISRAWDSFYGHRLYYLESFVDAEKFKGTSYKAANWEFLGLTSGRGTRAKTYKPTCPVKEVLGFALTRNFRELLGSV